MPPIRLLGTGWGELATSLVVVVAVPVIGWAVQQAPASVALWWAVGILLPVHMAMMLAFELPDIESDTAAGKRVLGVRLGETRSGRLIAIMLVGHLTPGLSSNHLSQGLVGDRELLDVASHCAVFFCLIQPSRLLEC